MPGSRNKKNTSKNPKLEKSKKVKKNVANNSIRLKKKKVSTKDSIAKSKQLVQKLQTSRTSSGRSKTNTPNNEVRLCGNGKPMPSLAELERMFEDSDTDEEKEVKPASTVTTPKPEPEPHDPKILSPKTIKKLADKMLDLVSNLGESILIDEDGPPPPIKKPKKIKKSGIPYIVGCKERDYVPQKAKDNSFCKGDEEYGLNDSECENDEDDDVPKKRAKRTKKVNLSKSIFNAASDEIAARLKELDGTHSDGSSDSNKTVAYEYYTPINNSRPRPFSPLPSTSKDNDTFVKNDQLFNESLVSENMSTIENDLEIVETPCETIVINDNLGSNKTKVINDSSVIEIIEENSVENSENITKNVVSEVYGDDSVQLVDVKPASPILVEDYYSSLNTTMQTDDVYEVIDIDDVIAENAAIIKKYCKKDDLDTVTSVDMSNSVVTVVDSESSTFDIDKNNSTNENRTNSHPPLTSTPNRPNKPSTSNTQDANIDNSMIQDLQKDLREIQRLLNIGPDHRNMLKTAINNLNNYNSQQDSNNFGHTQTDLGACIYVPDNTSSPPSFAQGSRTQTDQAPSSMSTNSPETVSKRIGDCPICMDSLSSKSIASTMCGHIFCMNCIKQAIKANGRKCPTCRKSLRGAGFHQIFL